MLAFSLPPGAIVCGHLALAQIRRTGERGQGLAITGAAVGYAFTGVMVLIVLLWLLVAAAVGVGRLAFLATAAQRA